MQRASRKSTVEVAKGSEQVKPNSVFRRAIKETWEAGKFVARHHIRTIFITTALVAAFNSNTVKAQTKIDSSANEQQVKYRSLKTTLDGYNGEYLVYADGGVIGLFPTRKDAEGVILDGIGPILADCVATNGYYFGVSKTGVVFIGSKGGFTATFSELFGQKITLTDSPVLVAGPNGSAILTDKNLYDKEAGVYVIVQLSVGDGLLKAHFSAGDKLISMVK